MVARISILIILLALLPDIYIYRKFLRHRFDLTPWQHLLWWIPGAAIIAYTVMLSMIRDFAPDNITWLNVYLFLVGLIIVPKVLFVLCSLAGSGIKRIFGLKRNWGNYAGLLAVLGTLYILFYGAMIGNDRLTVRRVTIEFDNLPQSFDGYRIAQFSDAHLGSMDDEMLRRAVTEINGLRADMIVFTGDLQNMRPQELPRFQSTLKELHATDGIYSVLGNHDYAGYVNRSERTKHAYEAMTIRFERSVGWNLLLNERRIIRRSADSIVIAGCENDGRPPFPSKADLKKTLHGISHKAFVIMLQHDPSAWQRHILPESNASLTLSGHTHGGQFSLFGLRPTQLTAREDDGLYDKDGRMLFVSTGLGGFVPFRFNMPPEVVEITLKRKTTHN